MAQRPPSAFPGFPAAGTRFLRGLEEDNSREYFAAHRDDFVRGLHEPMAALLDALPQPYQPFHVFRMNRDVRFSPDKPPYKTGLGAVHSDGGSVHYVHVDGRGLMAACGAYLMSPAELEDYRAAVVDDRAGPELERILAGLADQGLEVDHGGVAPLKTAPRGYPKDAPRIELLRWKGVIASRSLSAARTRSGEAVLQFVIETFQRAAPLHDWLRAHVGAPTEDATVAAGGRRGS